MASSMPILSEIITQDESEGYVSVPHNIPAEQSILGALLTNNQAIYKVSEYLRAEHFYEPVHARIYEAILVFMERGIVATPVSLKNYFEKDAALKEIGGAEYLVKLAGLSASIINLEAYGKVIYDLYLLRCLVEIGEGVVNNARNTDIAETARQQIERTEQSLFLLASEGDIERGFQPLKQSLADAIERADAAYKSSSRVTGIETGLSDLDTILGGLQNSDLLILAARPSMGKTALAVSMALGACKHLKNHHNDPSVLAPSVGFFSLEMSSEQLAMRMMAMEASVNSSDIRKGRLDEQSFAKLVEANERIHNLAFFIDDTPALSIQALRTRARKLKRRHNLGCLVVDYLQLVRGSSKMSESNRVQEISEITQGLKAIAKELNIPVIALSQLSRAVEQREDKRPQLSDLRESGSIEQDADIVMFIFREEYYLSRKEPSIDKQDEHQKWQMDMEKVSNIAEVMIAKQRNGAIGNVRLRFDNRTTGFSNLDEIHKDTY
jgi:replicative DNA helicase